MIPAHAFVALIMAINITPTQTPQETDLLQQQAPFEKKQVSFREGSQESFGPPRFDFLKPFKEGYIQDEICLPARVYPPKKQHFNRRKCHGDVNFYGTKRYLGRPNLRACGRR